MVVLFVFVTLKVQCFTVFLYMVVSGCFLASVLWIITELLIVCL